MQGAQGAAANGGIALLLESKRLVATAAGPEVVSLHSTVMRAKLGNDLREESPGKTANGEFTVYAIEDEAKLETRAWFVKKNSEYALVVYMNSEGADAEEVAHIQRAVMASQSESKSWWKLW